MDKSYTVIIDGKKTQRALGGERRLAEILTEEEYERIKAGQLCAFIPVQSGVCLVPLDGRLSPGDTLELLPADSEEAVRRLTWLFK